MNLNFQLVSNFRTLLLDAALDFGDQSVVWKAYLMRHGYSFPSGTCHLRRNFKVSVTIASNVYIVGGTTKTIYRKAGSGSFIDDGFIVGNYINTTNGSNNFLMIVRSMGSDGLSMRVDPVDPDNNTVTTAGTAESPLTTITISSHDEHEPGTYQSYTPYDPDANNYVTFRLVDDVLTLNKMDLSDTGIFGVDATDHYFYDTDHWDQDIDGSPGFIICKHNAETPEDSIVVMYCRFSEWQISI